MLFTFVNTSCSSFKNNSDSFIYYIINDLNLNLGLNCCSLYCDDLEFVKLYKINLIDDFVFGLNKSKLIKLNNDLITFNITVKDYSLYNNAPNNDMLFYILISVLIGTWLLCLFYCGYRATKSRLYRKQNIVPDPNSIIEPMQIIGAMQELRNLDDTMVEVDL